MKAAAQSPAIPQIKILNFEEHISYDELLSDYFAGGPIRWRTITKERAQAAQKAARRMCVASTKSVEAYIWLSMVDIHPDRSPLYAGFVRIGENWYVRATKENEFAKHVATLRAYIEPDSIIGEVDEMAEMERLAEIAKNVLRLTGLNNTIFSEIQDEYNFHLYNLFGEGNAPAISIALETALRLHPETCAPQFAPLYTVTGYEQSLHTQHEPGETHDVDLSQHLKADDAVKAAILAVIEGRINLALCTA